MIFTLLVQHQLAAALKFGETISKELQRFSSAQAQMLQARREAQYQHRQAQEAAKRAGDKL